MTSINSKYILTSLLLVFFSINTFAKEKIVIGVLSDNSSFQSNMDIQLIKEEVNSLTQNEFDVFFPKEKYFYNSWDKKKIEKNLSTLYKDKDVDIVLILGYGSSAIGINQKKYSKPTLISPIINTKLVNAPLKKSSSGKKNLTYVSMEANLEDELTTFKRLVNFKKVAVLSDPFMSEAMPNLRKMGNSIAKKLDIDVISVPFYDENNDIQNIPSDVDAVMIGALPRLNKENLISLLEDLKKRNLPSYSLIDSELVSMGALISNISIGNKLKNARRIALNLQSILLNQKAENINVFMNIEKELTINMETARELSIPLPFDILLDAKRINGKNDDIKVNWSLEKVANEALKQNLDINMSKLDVDIRKSLLNQQKSLFLPQLSINTNHKYSNADNSSIAKQNGIAYMSLSQIIYDETTWANLDIENMKQKSTYLTFKEKELDVVQDATIAFLEILKNKTLLGIQEEKIYLSKANLKAAEDRVKRGTSNNSDVYRWENELANSKVDWLEAKSTFKIAQENLNLILNRPLYEKFHVEKTIIDNPIFIMNSKELIGLIKNNLNLRNLDKTLISIGLDKSPEISSTLTELAIEKRTLKKEKRMHYLPKVSLNGEYKNTYYDSRNNSLSQEDDNDWNVDLQFSLPIYEGGLREDKIIESKLKLRQLKLNLIKSKKTIEQNIRKSLYKAHTSRLSLDLKETSAKVSEKNYELVLDSYNKGLSGILDLIDAQNEKTTSSLNSVNATYDFLSNLMNLQRSLGQFDFFLTESERNNKIKLIKENLSQGNINVQN